MLLLAVLLLPFIALIAVLAASARRKRWAHLVAERLSTTLIRQGNPLPHWLSLGCLLLGTALLLIALARPQGASVNQAEKSQGRNVLIALDLSRSMRVADVKPDRLTQAKLLTYELLEALPNERFGLIAFAGEANLYAPLTVDHGGVRETIEQMDENWPTQGGTDLGAAVELAVETLRKTGQKRNALIILSDGEKHAGDTAEMIRMARESGVYILAIGIGTDDGDYVPHPDFPSQPMLDRNGTPVISRLQADVLQRLAAGTGGAYAQAGSGANLSAMVRSAVAGMEAYEMTGRQRQVRVEFYQWFTLPGILLLITGLIAGTRWRALGLRHALPGILLILGSMTTLAADPPQDAMSAFKSGNYNQAASCFEEAANQSWLPQRRATLRLAAGAAWQRIPDFEKASAAYSEALREGGDTVRARAHCGMGNTLFQLGWTMLENKPYGSDGKQVTDMAHFDQLVSKLLSADGDPPADAPLLPNEQIEALITRWTDAVRHYDSALALGEDAVARHNRGLTMAYLKRLAELLEEDAKRHEEELSQCIPKPDPSSSSGQDKPDQGKPDPNSQSKPGQEGPGGDPKQTRPQGQGTEPFQPNPDRKPGNGERSPDDQPQGNNGQRSESAPKPGENPVEHALRMLKENSDVETGPMTPGQFRHREPEKDW